MAKRGEDPDTEFPFITNRVLEAEYKKKKWTSNCTAFQLDFSIVSFRSEFANNTLLMSPSSFGAQEKISLFFRLAL